MKTILVVCATPRDKRELCRESITSNYKIVFYEYDDCEFEKITCDGVGWLTYDFDPAKLIEDIVAFAREHSVDGIICTEDYPGSILASIVAKKLGLPGPEPHSVIGHHHKYYSRILQQQHVPEATPGFKLIDPQKNIANERFVFPLFLKPVNSSFSVFANEVHMYNDLLYWIKNARWPARFLKQFDWFLDQYSDCNITADSFVAEDVLIGEQCTLEGFVLDGEVTILGVVDSIMFPGTISFKRFEYPSCLPQKVQDCMANIACVLMQKAGFNNSFFNIEFMYNPKTGCIQIIEVNPRAASQFADLYEKVDGINSYHHLIQLALGKEPILKKSDGVHNIAASCVLRLFKNKLVTKSPGQKELRELYHEFPDVRCQLFVQKGQQLSESPQDGKSYRYGLIHLGARDHQELQEKFEHCKRILDFEFEDV